MLDDFDAFRRAYLRPMSAKDVFVRPDAVTPAAARPWEPEETEKFRRLRAAGWSASDCAKRLPGRSVEAIRERARRLGIPFGKAK